MSDQERAVMQQALRALLMTYSITSPHCDLQWEAITALKAALEQQPEPAQEPVAWATEIIDALQAQYDTEMIKENDSGDALIRLDDAIAAVEDAEKHHTVPPQRPPLTDEEIAVIEESCMGLVQYGGHENMTQERVFDVLAFARAIERKVRGE